MTRSMLHSKDQPEHFWAEAINTAAYIRNRVTSRALPSNITPHHIWHGKKPNVLHLRTFGSECWYIIPKVKVKKLDARARKSLMMGYPTGTKGYKIWDLTTEKFLVSRDVYFSNPIPTKAGIQNPSSVAYMPTSELCDEIRGSESEVENHFPYEPVQSTLESGTSDQFTGESDNSSIPPKLTLRRSSRKSKPPGEWWKTYKNTDADEEAQAETALVAERFVPSTFSEALLPENKEFWLPAVKSEENSLIENSTFTIVPRDPNISVIPCKYIFKLKNGTPKVRIVAKGFRQKHGINYFETYAPEVSFTAVRCFLSYVAHLDLECDQMDVVTAFLNGDLEETIHREIPPGFVESSNVGKVCLLHKALYGLKQAPRQWYAKINAYLVDELKFSSCSYEPCLYFRHRREDVTVIVLYVDDLLIAGDSRNVVDGVKLQLSGRFKMKDLGHAEEFLGIRISRNRTLRQLHISQTVYARKVLSRFRMDQARESNIPMEINLDGGTGEQDAIVTSFPYREAIGCLMYLMICTRPDISLAVGKLSQFCDAPKPEHITAIKRLLRYIKSTIAKGLTYHESDELVAKGYSESDWGGCKTTRKSSEGYVFLFGGGAVCWRSKKQSIVATSSCEAEYMAAYSAAKESIWLSKMIAEMTGSKETRPQTIFVDNQGAIALAKRNTVSSRSKHIENRYHYIQDALVNNLLKLEYIPSKSPSADLLTKPLARIQFQKFTETLGLTENPVRTQTVQGGVLSVPPDSANSSNI